MAKNFRQGSLFNVNDVVAAASSPPTKPAPSQPVSNESTASKITALDSPLEVIHLTPAPATENIPASLVGKTVYVVDSLSLIFQVFHAIPEMTGPRGEPVGALFGFARDLITLLNRKPDYLFFAWDVGSTTFRNELYGDYKLHRTEMPVDLRPQLGQIERMLEAVGTPRLGCENYEADDILAMLAAQTHQRGGECFLITADKDCRQLITERVKMLNMRKNIVLDAAGLYEDWGVRPDQVVDYQTLVGDPVDHVPGVPLIGPKIARELLQKYDTLDNLYAHIDELPAGKRKQNLIDHREQAMLSRQLVRLTPDVPLPVDWEQGRVDRLDPQRLLPLLAEFGIHGLANQIRGAAAAAKTVPALVTDWHTDYHLIDTPQAIESFLTQLKTQRQFAFDVIADNASPLRAKIIGFAISWQPGQAWYLPVQSPFGEPHLDAAATLAALKPLLEDSEREKLGHDLKFDVLALRAAGVQMAGVVFDSMVASYLLDAGERNHTLDELAQRYFSYTVKKLAPAVGSKTVPALAAVAPQELADYVCQYVDLVSRLRPLLTEKLHDSALDNLFSTLEMPLVSVLAELEFNGIRIDQRQLAALSERYGQRIAVLEAEIFALAGHPFNIGSPKQLAEVLFKELQLPVVKKTKTGVSTDVEVLEELATQHALPAKIIEYRQFAKLKSTYVDALPQLALPATGRVHTSFNQVVAATGRLSSSDPNLQNIPIRTEAGREIRSVFLPGDDAWKLVAADYSQVELRVLAHFCGDAAMRAAFANNEDIHTRVASQVYGVALADVTPNMRRVAKAVNFGVIYGQSPFGLAKALSISQAEAAQFISAYFAGYPDIDQFLETILVGCRKNGYVTTILGRRRAIRGVRDPQDAHKGDPENRQRNLSERTAINTVIQGSAADLIKLAMIAIDARLRTENLQSRMLLQIHDELIFEAPAQELGTLARLISEEMAGVMKLDVPLGVDVKVGRNWAEVEAVVDAAALDLSQISALN